LIYLTFSSKDKNLHEHGRIQTLQVKCLGPNLGAIFHVFGIGLATQTAPQTQRKISHHNTKSPPRLKSYLTRAEQLATQIPKGCRPKGSMPKFKVIKKLSLNFKLFPCYSGEFSHARICSLCVRIVPGLDTDNL